ncbi:MAG: hypothetical protein RL226_208 [Bacteroidota bacterium]
MIHFTLDELSSFSQEERELLNEIFNTEAMLDQAAVELKPRETSVDRILAYSKALSVRKTKNHRIIKMVLN